MVKKIPVLAMDAIPMSRSLGLKYGHCEALIIQQLHFLLNTNPMMREGIPWYFRSYREWADDILLFGLSSVKSAIYNLEKKGVLIVGNFNKKSYDQTKWYTLNYDVLSGTGDANVLKKASTLGQNLTATLGQNLTAPPAKNQPTNTIDINTEKNTEINTVSHPFGMAKNNQPKPAIKLKAGGSEPVQVLVSPAPGNPQTFDTLSGPDSTTVTGPTTTEVQLMAKGPTSAAAVLKQLQCNKAGINPSTKPNTPKSAWETWQRLVPKHHPSVGMIPEFKIMEKGQFGHISKILGGSSDKVIAYCIAHWTGYAKEVANKAGLKNVPEVPQIGFLLKFVNEARSFATKGNSAPPVQSIAPKMVKKGPVNLVKQAKEEQKSTGVVSATSDGDGDGDGDGVASLEDILAWKPKGGKE